MNATQIILAVGYGLLFAGSVWFGWRIICSTQARHRRQPADIEAITRRETSFAWVIAGLLVVLMIITAFAVPYGDTSAGEGGQVVEVRAFQFGWTVEPAAVQTGRKVEFRVRSADVAHGFGLYKGTKLLAQAQIPARNPNSDSDVGPEQRLVYTFDDPGTYELLCLEFCGSKHHAMQAKIEVEG